MSAQITAALLGAVSGALTLAYAVVALFFLKFHRRTRDRLFAHFALAFLLLAVQRLVLSLAGEWTEDSIWLYGTRLLAFVTIIVAIVDKNRSAGRE